MLYKELVEIYENLEKTTKKLEKRDILAQLYKKCSNKDLYPVVLLSMGDVYPVSELELGIATELMKKIIADTFGIPTSHVEELFKGYGDLGSVAETLSKKKKQTTLLRKELTVERVFENLRELPKITGEKSQERKASLIKELLLHAEPREAKYIVRTILGELRIGVAEGIIRDAIAKAFNKDPKKVEEVFDVIGDYGKVAEMTRKGELKAEIKPGMPIRVMLAERAMNLEEAMNAFENPCIEVKYDGFRILIHKDGEKIKLFSRRLDEVTKQFPEIVKWAKTHVLAESAILDGEALAIDLKTGKPLPFQKLSRRIQRKYDIEKMIKEIPVQVNLFDLVYVDGENWMKRPLKERWKKLNSIIKVLKGRFKTADHIETKDLKKAKKFYKKALEMGEEGIMVKNLDAHYKPGKRVGYWLKVKPIMEPLDLVIIGGEWGEGKRAKWISSIILAAKNEEGNFLPTGMMGSGLTEEQFEELTKRVKKIIIKESGRKVEVSPEIVVEVAYQEIQKSTKYPTGYALRFPRLLRFRDDKRSDDINTVSDIERLYKMQKTTKKTFK
ncbi:MAG: ATP-dependent DNA ligase [Candidatus Aenigmarchaeota archaeon]|nr:ATP-dependent DNA ligase [Candidatus Aenigmarchaeota archaeon]